MEEKPEPSAHPLAGLNYKESRNLFLEDWATTVQPPVDAGHRYIEHSVTYGSTALQAGYIINGGALGALPLLLTAFSAASKSTVATAAIPFVAGIAFTAISSVAAYMNFQWLGLLSWHDGDVNAALLKNFYQRDQTPLPDPKGRERLSRLIRKSYYVGLGAGIASLVSFLVGAAVFIAIARHAS